MREYENLIGQRFGKLLVKSLLPSDGTGHRRWLCECDCGNTHTATTGNLKSGHATNCGCGKSPDLSGKVFGQITVIKRSPTKRKRGDRFLVEWECRCTCGATVFRTTDQLSDKKNRMCAECALNNSVSKAFEAAGFEQGTQISKIKEMKTIATNTSGCRGVYWHKKQRKWVARLKFKSNTINIGSYAKFEDAVTARKAAEEEYFGSFLREIEQVD